MPVGKTLAALAQRIDRAFFADAAHHILQQPALGRMVENVAGGDGLHPGARGEAAKIAQPDRIAGPAPDREGEIGAGPEDGSKPVERLLARRIGAVGHQYADHSFPPVRHVRPVEMAAALAATGLADAQKPAEPRIGLPVSWIDEKRGAADKVKAAANDRAAAGDLLCVPGPYGTGKTVAVGDA